MTRDEVIRLAREAGTEVQATSLLVPFLERFAALVAAQEREACAELCNAEALIDSPTKFEVAAINKCAAAIIARSKE